MAEHHGAAARRRTTGRADRSRHFTRSLTCVVQSAAFGSGVHVTRQSRAPPTVSPHPRPREVRVATLQTHGNGCDDSTASAAAGVKAFESLRVRQTSAGGLLTTTASSLLGARFSLSRPVSRTAPRAVTSPGAPARSLRRVPAAPRAACSRRLVRRPEAVARHPPAEPTRARAPAGASSNPHRTNLADTATVLICGPANGPPGP